MDEFGVGVTLQVRRHLTWQSLSYCLSPAGGLHGAIAFELYTHGFERSAIGRESAVTREAATLTASSKSHWAHALCSLDDEIAELAAQPMLQQLIPVCCIVLDPGMEARGSLWSSLLDDTWLGA